MTPPTEPLADLARFAFAEAPDLCDPAHGCCVYHRAWSTIRLLLKDGAQPAGMDFFAEGLAQAAVNGRCRVLISGAADSGVAAMVLTALAGRGITADLVVAERCATPIAQNRRFADHLGLHFELHQGDILTLDCAPVDAVVAHSFLNFLPAHLRPALVATWARLLRPGGLVLLHQKLGDLRWAPDAETLGANRARLEAQARARGIDAQTAQHIGAAGVAFWTRERPHSTTREDELNDLLAQAGLEQIRLESLGQLSVGSPSYVAGVSSNTPQSLVMARRPG
ncbi:MAG: class I SAM-dependent methyltransferase [Paracoccaceae bacterium]|jgi:SAM-dependent methyltransferase|nr:class I SAM-dependent methyltransferase [Paracoccaceae bacterium]